MTATPTLPTLPMNTDPQELTMTATLIPPTLAATATSTTESGAKPARSHHRPPDTSTSGEVTFQRVLTAEWLKLRTLRSTWLMLAAAAAAMLATGLAIAYATRGTGVEADDAVPSATLQGYFLAQLFTGALGVLFVSSEYGTGMIRATMSAVPRRWPVMAAKSLVLTVVVAVPLVAASVVTFLVTQPILSEGASLTDPGVLRAVLGTGVYLTVVALLGGALGWLLRSTAAAVVALLGLLLVATPLLQALPGSVSTQASKWMPNNAGESLISLAERPDTLGPWAGIAVMGAWATAGLIGAGVLLRSRDV